MQPTLYQGVSSRLSLTLSFHLRLGLPSFLFPPDLSTKPLYGSLLSQIHVTCYVHLILHLITRIILCAKVPDFSLKKVWLSKIKYLSNVVDKDLVRRTNCCVLLSETAQVGNASDLCREGLVTSGRDMHFPALVHGNFPYSHKACGEYRTVASIHAFL